MSDEKTQSQEQSAAKTVEIPEKFKPIVDQIDKLSALELSELVKVLEEHYGVSAAAPVAVAAVAGGGAGGGEGGGEEKSAFTVELTAAGDKKINVIKIVKEITGKGLKEAKELVDSAPKPLKENVKKEEAEELKKKLEEAGATVTLK